MGVEFDAVNLVEKTPNSKELGMLLMSKEWDIRQIFDYDSSVYRRLELDDIIYDLSVDEAIKLLLSNGRLIPSPFLVTDSGCYAPLTNEADLAYILGSAPLAA